MGDYMVHDEGISKIEGDCDALAQITCVFPKQVHKLVDFLNWYVKNALYYISLVYKPK